MEKETPCMSAAWKTILKQVPGMLIVEKKGMMYLVCIKTSVLIVEKTGLLYILKLVC